MSLDDIYRDCTTTLWALIGATRAGDERDVLAAAEAALAALQAARGTETYVLLHELEGVIHVNGRQVQLGVDVFAAAHGIATLLRSRGVGEVLFDTAVDAEALAEWARCWLEPAAPAADADAELHDGVASGIHASRRDADAQPMMPTRRRAAPAPGADSQLRALFLQHQLIAALTASGPVPPTMAKVVVQAVVDRLIALPGGLEPLILLQESEDLLRRSLYVAVLTVVFARVAGWPEERLADLGGAALLHDLGAILDPARPAPAAFRWLLQRGDEEFWWRSAIVARTWREAGGGSLDEVAAGGAGVAVLVRMAVESEGLARGGAAAGGLSEALAARLQGQVPVEFLQAAAQAFAGIAA